MQTATHKRNVLDTALALLRGIAADDQWITVHPNGPDGKGRPALIDESGTIKAGMGGKFNGRNIDDVPRGKNPHPVTEEKYQARQKRMAEKSAPAQSTAQSGGASVASKYTEPTTKNIYEVDDPELKEKINKFRDINPKNRLGFIHNGIVIIPDKERDGDNVNMQSLEAFEKEVQQTLAQSPERVGEWEGIKKQLGLGEPSPASNRQ